MENSKIPLQQLLHLRTPTLDLERLVLPRLTLLARPDAVERHLREPEHAEEHGHHVQRVPDGHPGDVYETADKLAAWFGLSNREIEWVRSARAGNDDDGYSEALLGVDGEGWFPLRVRASAYEVEVLDG